MSRDILSEYGPEGATPQVPRATNGGVMPVKDVMRYAPPVAAKVNFPKRPGLADGVNNGINGTQGGTERLQRGGEPGLIGGINYGPCGSQGKY